MAPFRRPPGHARKPVDDPQRCPKGEGHEQIQGSRREVEFKRTERGGLERIGDRGEIDGGDGRNHAGAQHQQDELARQRGKDRLERREYHDEAEDVEAAKPERAPGLDLALRHRIDARAHDLGRIGAEIRHHGGERGLVGVEPDAERRQREIDDEELDEKRRVANELDIAGDEPAERTRSAGADIGAEHRHHEAEQHCRRR
jgi:hypothetical protein